MQGGGGRQAGQGGGGEAGRAGAAAEGGTGGGEGGQGGKGGGEGGQGGKGGGRQCKGCCRVRWGRQSWGREGRGHCVDLSLYECHTPPPLKTHSTATQLCPLLAPQHSHTTVPTLGTTAQPHNCSHSWHHTTRLQLDGTSLKPPPRTHTHTLSLSNTPSLSYTHTQRAVGWCLPQAGSAAGTDAGLPEYAGHLCPHAGKQPQPGGEGASRWSVRG